MSKTSFKIGPPSEFTEDEKLAFVDLLNQQGKVVDPSLLKLNSCKLLAVSFLDNNFVSIGAIKRKTASDFGPTKADLPGLRDQFDWELGYCFTPPEYTGNGYSSEIVEKLIEAAGKIKLIASTEVSGSSMRGILERNGFKQKGKIWPSGIHGGELGLFLRVPV